ncbi:nucleotidyl transferase AbiEii/AbiGii toxin family protein [Intrasporangium calvum]|uniref:nucleotidyl transferase AbiEii/AbiGii toxin family protein n=1 Tax=Intrasporangium calvum TaxID=53358 RepID=UPI000DF60C3D|nr:nucleotidyl transferase AbiEii/AbiGii toxin family protein [Intrasporangium calvum]AXG14272.1 hypothetical protein DN585_13420 [Intrasporangium calvum]
MGRGRSLLTPFQLEVARLFFALPAAEGFLLAGGAALLAQELTHRPTQDLDFFTTRGADDVVRAKDEFTAAALARGWVVEHVQGSGEFCRLLIHGREDDLLVDLALESKPGMPATASVAGPTFAPQELAGRKLIALFDRAAARDFVDVYSLARLFGKPTLLARAALIDLGFDTKVLAAMMDHLDAYTDADLFLDEQVTDIPALRAFFADWTIELRHG